MTESTEINSCMDQVEEMFGRFLALFAVDCLLWPAIERVAADIEAMSDAGGEACRRMVSGSGGLQAERYLDD